MGVQTSGCQGLGMRIGEWKEGGVWLHAGIELEPNDVQMGKEISLI